MESNILKETIDSCAERWRSRIDIPLDSELLIPDYHPTVFKIVKTLIAPVILQKHTADRKLAVDGYLRCSIFYQSEDGGQLCQIEQKVPYSKTIEIPEGIFRDELIEIKGEAEYMNCRATHSRRMELRGNYILLISSDVLKTETVLRQLDDPKLEQKITQIKAVQLLPSSEKVISCQEEIDLTDSKGSVLYITGQTHIDEIRKTDGKALLKGKAVGSILFTCPEEKTIQSKAFTVSIRQVVEIPGLDEDSICHGEIIPVSWTLESSQSNTADLTMTGLVSLKAWCQKEIMLVEDAFSPEYQTTEEFVQLSPERLHSTVRETLRYSFTLPMEETAQVLFSTLKAELPEWQKGSFTGKGTVYVFLRNAMGEMECREQTFEYSWGKEFPETVRLEAELRPGEVTVLRNGGQATVNFDLELDGLVMDIGPVSALRSIKLGEPYPETEDAPALHICYARKGQSLFHIAKALRASPKAIMACNDLEGEILEQPKRLLVPRAN